MSTADHLYGIGDIHGEYDKLVDLIRKIKPGKKDKFVFLGDYIDRGTKSKNVIDFLIDFSKKHSCVFLIGNHEAMMLETLVGDGDDQNWLFNGGGSTIQSYGSIEAILNLHHHFFKNLKLYYETEKYLFVHAGIRPNVPLDKQTLDDLIWIREPFILHKTEFPKKIIYGHTPIDHIKSPFPDKIGLDTGAVYGGPLTAIRLPEEKLIQSNPG